jgi:hypothetical protein
MWDFGQLIYWGPLVVSPDIAFEPSVVRPAVTAASDVDHAIFIDRVADAVLDPGGHLRDSFAPVGGARFAEDYLSPEALDTDGCRRLLDAGIGYFASAGEPGLMVAPDLLTSIQRERLLEIRAGRWPRLGPCRVTDGGYPLPTIHRSMRAGRARMVCPFPGQLPVGSWGPWEH